MQRRQETEEKQMVQLHCGRPASCFFLALQKVAGLLSWFPLVRVGNIQSAGIVEKPGMCKG
jgi:hypothetical protein